MEQVIACKRYDQSIILIHNYIECVYASQEEKDELSSLYKRLTIDKEDPIRIYDIVHNLTYSIWYKGYLEHERGYMCIIL
jgi:hypothetical protein